jgi:hypothetical protein
VNTLKHFMRIATTAEQEELAAAAGTSRQYLYKLANSGTDYARTAKADLAAKLEGASAVMHRASKGRLPRLYRTDLNDACRACPFAQRCLGELATRSHFEIFEGAGDAATGD